MDEALYEMRCVCCGRFLGEVSGQMPDSLRIRCSKPTCHCWMIFQPRGGGILVSRWHPQAQVLDKPGNLR